MGLGITVPVPGLSVIIDAATLLYFKVLNRKEIQPQENSDLDVTAIISARNEERWIRQCVESLFRQTMPPKKVIVVDDYSQDKTSEICMELDKEYLDFIYIRRRERCGKANNLNYATQLVLNDKRLLSQIVVIVDGDTVPRSDFIEQMTKPFISKDIAAVSGTGFVTKPENFAGKVIAATYRFLFKFYSWQKTSQNHRNAISPVCGGAVAYRTEVLGKIAIPARCITEDTDHTWLLLENKYKVVHNPKALVDSEQARTLRGFFRQWYRWYSGSHQALHIHGRKLLDAKKLLFTTLIPSCIDGWIYSVWLVGFLFFSFLDPVWSMWLMAADVGLTGLVLGLLCPRELKYLPMIWIMKFPLAVAWLTSGLRTLWERLTNKQHLWGKAWERADHRTSGKKFSFLIRAATYLLPRKSNNPTKETIKCRFYQSLKMLQSKQVPNQCLQCRNLIECIEK